MWLHDVTKAESQLVVANRSSCLSGMYHIIKLAHALDYM